jgi:hypothetical protein
MQNKKDFLGRTGITTTAVTIDQAMTWPPKLASPRDRSKKVSTANRSPRAKGTATAIRNKNRPKQGIEVPTASVVRDPTVNDAGLLLENEFIPGGTGPQAVGGAASTRSEWVLKPGTVYLVRMTNRAGNNQPASLALEWYEESTNG